MNDLNLIISEEIIGFYEREFYFLSNFSSFQVDWNEKLWPTSEHAYQASKFLKNNLKIAEEILKTRSAHDAKKLAEKSADLVDPNFKETKINIMEDICRHKLQQHPYIQKKLLQTEDKQLIEDSPKDSFWGIGPNKDGRNELGKIWMKLRTELIKQNN